MGISPFLDENKSFEGYLFIITRNVIFNHSRRYYKETALKITAIQAVEESYDMEGELDAADLKKYIDELVMQLPPRQQEVFRMSRELHMSNKEIAEHFSITEKAIERHINLALRFLKRILIFSCCSWERDQNRDSIILSAIHLPVPYTPVPQQSVHPASHC